MDNFLDWLHSISEIASLATTPAVLIFAAATIWYWLPSVIDGFKRLDRSERHWLKLGIVIGFVGAFVDNFYWGIAWTADFVGLPVRDTIFKWGVASNLPFRQILGICAGYCHVRAHMEADDPRLATMKRASIYSGVILVVALLLMRAA